jgi:hypothetical protein
LTVADQLCERAKLLPQPLAQEALDCVLFLRARQERVEWRDLIYAQNATLAAVWDNSEDEAWNDVRVGRPGSVALPVLRFEQHQAAPRTVADGTSPQGDLIACRVTSRAGWPDARPLTADDLEACCRGPVGSVQIRW